MSSAKATSAAADEQTQRVLLGEATTGHASARWRGNSPASPSILDLSPRTERLAAGGALTGLLLVRPAGASLERATAIAEEFPGCTALNRVHPHRVGRVGARDRTSGTVLEAAKETHGPLDRRTEAILGLGIVTSVLVTYGAIGYGLYALVSSAV